MEDIQGLYIRISQLKAILATIKKSEQKSNDPYFKKIWIIIKKHNEFCNHPECPLLELKNIVVDRHNDFL